MQPLKTKEIYFDNNATTKPLLPVRKAISDALSDTFGNPSSAHYSGERARNRIDAARDAVAGLIGADPGDVYFTSGGTESNNIVLNSFVFGKTNPKIVTTAIEHSSILKHCEMLEEIGVRISYLPVDGKGVVSFEDLEEFITPDTSLVSVQWVNNETGVIQPIEAIGDLCKKEGVPFHTDAAQAVGKLNIDLSRLPIDLLSMTGHKFHGPQGVGALYSRDRRSLRPLFFGGSQEGGIRPGTENVAGIAGIGKAAEIRSRRIRKVQKQLSELRDRFEDQILARIPGVEINGCKERRVCNTTNLLFRGVDGQALIAQLDQLDVRCSQSSACTNHRPEPSYVLRAMGLSEQDAYSSVRFSFAEGNTMDEVDWAVQQIEAICQRLRKFHGGYAQIPAMRG
jgi:cysteine desulfurase